MLFDPSPAHVLLLAGGAFLAGLVDAIVGGGGLIQIPVLFAAFPEMPPAVLFGTNKLASVAGTSTAAVQYARRIPIDWPAILPSLVAAFCTSWLGARTVSLFPPAYLRPLILVLLAAVAIHTYLRKDFGRLARPTPHPPAQRIGTAVAITATIGFYDGFFGPGTGTFLIFAFIRLIGMDFLSAAAGAKLINSVTNLGAILFFASHHSLLWGSALLMAGCNFAGALLGTRLALRRGIPFIRVVFLLVVACLIVKLGADFYLDR